MSGFSYSKQKALLATLAAWALIQGMGCFHNQWNGWRCRLLMEPSGPTSTHTADLAPRARQEVKGGEAAAATEVLSTISLVTGPRCPHFYLAYFPICPQK